MARDCGWQMPLLSGLFLMATFPALANTAEADIKVAFVYNFMKLVEWPATAFASGNSSFELCLLDNNALEGHLKTLDGHAAQGRVIHVRNLNRPSDWANCHVLYVDAASILHPSFALKPLGNAAVLTVSDAPGFIQKGGMIGLFVEDNRVQFSVNLGVTQQAGLKMSARMLQLAHTVSQGDR